MQHRQPRRRRPDPVQQVVSGDEDETERRDRRERQVHQRRQGDHRPAQRPQHDQQREAVIDVELITEAAEHDDLDHDQPEAAGEQQPRQRADRLLPQRQIRAGAGEQEKDRRAEMGDPAREEQRGARARDVGGTDPRHAEEIARVIERHHDHDRAADEVDRFEALQYPLSRRAARSICASLGR
jgi:hypothetical protein